MDNLIEAEHRFAGAPIEPAQIAAATERRRRREHLQREITRLNGLIEFHRSHAAAALEQRAQLQALLRTQAP